MRMPGWPARFDDAALQAVWAALPQARLVGGCVRDGLAGAPITDFDFATPQPPRHVTAALAAAGLRAAPTGLAHGTVTAISQGRGFEVTTLRRDINTDGRHATVAFTDDWRQDASRRDFTINAMSLAADGTVFDYVGGIGDLHAGRLRFVGDPAARLAEDRLRVLRYFRFFARYATQPPDEAVRAALAAARGACALLSAERVWGELKRILAAPDPQASLALMAELGVLHAVLPEAAETAPIARLVALGAPPDPILRLAALLRPQAPSPAARLRLSGAHAAWLEALRGAPVPLGDEPDDQLRRWLADTPASVLIGRSWLSGAPQRLRDRLAAMPRPVFPLEGRDLIANGFPPGPALGAALAALRARWLQSGCLADRATCLAWQEASVTPDLSSRNPVR